MAGSLDAQKLGSRLLEVGVEESIIMAWGKASNQARNSERNWAHYTEEIFLLSII